MNQRFEHTSTNYKSQIEHLATIGWGLCGMHNEKDCEGNDSVRYWMKRPVEISGEIPIDMSKGKRKEFFLECPLCGCSEKITDPIGCFILCAGCKNEYNK